MSDAIAKEISVAAGGTATEEGDSNPSASFGAHPGWISGHILTVTEAAVTPDDNGATAFVYSVAVGEEGSELDPTLKSEFTIVIY